MLKSGGGGVVLVAAAAFRRAGVLLVADGCWKMGKTKVLGLENVFPLVNTCFLPDASFDLTSLKWRKRISRASLLRSCRRRKTKSSMPTVAAPLVRATCSASSSSTRICVWTMPSTSVAESGWGVFASPKLCMIFRISELKQLMELVKLFRSIAGVGCGCGGGGSGSGVGGSGVGCGGSSCGVGRSCCGCLNCPLNGIGCCGITVKAI